MSQPFSQRTIKKIEEATERLRQINAELRAMIVQGSRFKVQGVDSDSESETLNSEPGILNPTGGGHNVP